MLSPRRYIKANELQVAEKIMDFTKAPKLVKSWFDLYLEDIDTLLENIQLHYKRQLKPRKSLIIFDEVQA